MKRVNHSVEYKAEDGACTNQAESYFSRLRRVEMGIHHRISGHRLQAYANEMAWRENHRRQPNGTHWNLITAAALAHPRAQRGRLLAPGEGGMTAGKDHVVSGLVAKRAELAGVIDQLQRQLDQYRADLTHIDGVLRILASDLDPETIRPTRLPPQPVFRSQRAISALSRGVPDRGRRAGERR